MQNPPVSIIITVYNKEKYIEECINSVTMQTYKYLRIVIVDDGSTDQTPQICDEFAALDNRITVIHKENGGMTAARNTGLDAATGEWICFIDGDDYIDKHYVEYLLKAATEHNALVAQCKYISVTTGREIIERQPYQSLSFDFESFMLYTGNVHGYNALGLWDKIWHSSMFESIRFPDDKDGLDLMTICKLLHSVRHKKFAVVNQTLYYYRQLQDSLSHSKRASLKAFDAWTRDYHDAMVFWKDRGSEPIYRLYLKYAYETGVLYAIECMRDIPGQSDKIAPLIDFIRQNVKDSAFAGYRSLFMRFDSCRVWEQIANCDTGIVLYGFGNNGKNEIYPWLSSFKIKIGEIWDVNGDGSFVDGTPFLKPHGNLDKSSLILISIGDDFISSQADARLRALGYNNIILYPALESSIRYAAYKKYLPFLLECEDE